MREATLIGHHGNVSCLCLGKDGDTLLSGGWDTRVILWSIASGHSRDFVGHDGAVQCCEMSGDMRTLVSCSRLGGLIVWDKARGLTTQPRPRRWRSV